MSSFKIDPIIDFSQLRRQNRDMSGMRYVIDADTTPARPVQIQSESVGSTALNRSLRRREDSRHRDRLLASPGLSPRLVRGYRITRYWTPSS
jgi:hypothetical protein